MGSLARLLRVCLGAALFVSVLAAGAILHLLLLPMAPRLAMAVVNEATATLFAGRLTIDRIGRLGLTRIDRVDAHVDDADGKTVVRVDGVTARVSTRALLLSLVSRHEPIVVDMAEVSIERVDAHLDADDSGVPRIARAFMLRSPSPENAPPGRGVRLALPHIHVDHALLRAQPSAPYDADMDDADARVTVSSLGLAVDLERAHVIVRGLPAGAKAEGDAEAHFERPLRGEQVARAGWTGTAGEIREHAKLELHGERLDAVLDVAPAGPAEICALWPPWPIAAVCSARAEAHGTLPRLAVSAHGLVGGGTVDLSGPVTLGASLLAVVHVDVNAFDGHALVSPIPCSNVSASGDVSLTARAVGTVDGRVNVTLTHAECQHTHLPPATLKADFTQTPQGETIGHGELAIREQGAPALVTLQLAQSQGASMLTFEADARADRLEAVQRFAGMASGSADLHTTGTIDLRRRALDAKVSGAARNLGIGGTSLVQARVESHVTGKLDAPSADFEIDGEEVRSGSVHVTAFRTQGHLTLDGGTKFRDLSVDLAGEGAPVHARAALASFSGAGARVDDAVVEGLGSPVSLTLNASPAGVTVQAKGAAIDLDRVGALVPLPVHAGKMSLDLDVVVKPGSANGHVALDLLHGAGFGLRDLTAHVEGRVHGRRASWRATASADDIGTLEGRSSSIEIGKGRLLTAGPWRHAWGAVDLDTRIDLARLAAHLPKGTLPFTEIQGQLEIAAHVARDSPTDMTPEVAVTARTTGLAFAGNRGTGTWRVEGVNPTFHAIVNGDTGDTSVDARVEDATGPLVTIEARSSAVPYAAVFSDEGVLAALRALPFDAHLELPSRPMNSLPSVLGTAQVRGDLSARVDWHGALLQPTVNATAALTRGRPDPQRVGLPFDLELSAGYDGAHLDATLRGSQRKAQVLEATARVNSRAADWLASPAGSPPDWTASAQAKLDRFPLRSLEQLDDRQVSGFVSGELSVDGLHDDARATGMLAFEGLQIGDIACKESTLKASVDGHALDATADLNQADGGSIQIQAHSGAHWGSAITPRIDASQPAQASLSAKQFRAALLLPFVSGSFAELGGRIDGDARVEIDPAREIARPSGTIAWTEGTFELATMGSEFHGVSAKLAMTPDGVIRLQDGVAHGTTGKVSAYASAWLAGFSLGGASATMEIPSDDPLPLAFHGVPLGKVNGRFDMTANRTAQELDLVVDVPSAAFGLATGSTARGVEELGDLAGVHIGVQRAPDEFIELALDAARDEEVDPTSSAAKGAAAKAPTKIEIRLGRDVQVTRGTDLDVRLEGHPTVTIGPGVHVAGQIRLVRGKINVQGKPFEIEQGTVTFVGAEASNPQVVLTAEWTATDGTRVFADFVGPLKTGKVTLRSEPSRPQNEILALLLFGTTDQSSTSSTPGAASAAAAAGGVATQPLNQALGGINRSLDKLGLAGGISTKVDTSTPNPRPEVEVQIARDISVQVAWVLGVLPPGTNPDTAYLTLNWRFLRNVSLETTVGDAGSSIVDMIWQHRY